MLLLETTCSLNQPQIKCGLALSTVYQLRLGAGQKKDSTSLHFTAPSRQLGQNPLSAPTACPSCTPKKGRRKETAIWTCSGIKKFTKLFHSKTSMGIILMLFTMTLSRKYKRNRLSWWKSESESLFVNWNRYPIIMEDTKKKKSMSGNKRFPWL